MKIFHQSFQYTPSNPSDYIELVSLLQPMRNNFCSRLFKKEVIDRYMHCIMQNFKINAQVCIYTL